jgi:hypothetical protein
MATVHSILAASDRVIAALISGLEIEFGEGAGEALAYRFLEAEETDFRWNARLQERWTGAYESADGEEDFELDRVRILGRLGGRWFAATMIVDGDGKVHGMLGNREFDGEQSALQAFTDA